MGIKVMDATGVLRTATAVKVWNGTAAVSAARVKLQRASTLDTVAEFAPPLSAAASPTTASGTVVSSYVSPVTTNAVTVTPTGGMSPFTYAWTVVSYSAAIIPTVGSPTSAATTFTQGNVPQDTTETAAMRCTVTDAFGQTAIVNVAADFTVISYA